MKTFVKTICVGNYYAYCVYKITDWVGRTYYIAEPITKGITRCCETEDGLQKMLEADVKLLNEFWARVR